ncbi:MAG: radical SAM protein, partial [Candidatus Omnitrophica bacterium]|nr:radical SAM protein [Candidatus Omnitrophota bacterium]
GTHNFDFVDDTLTLEKERLLGLCDLIISRGLRINWICNARVNGFDDDMALKLKEAGCRNVCFGVESGDPEVWKTVNKAVTREEILSAHRAARRAGLIVTSFFMVGNVGESRESIDKTIKFMNEIETDYPTCSIATPYPGTEMYRMGQANGWIRVREWDEYVTTPHVKMDYRPVWTNGIMSEKEILDAYYLVNSRIISKKLVTRYGRLYYLNPRFYKNEIVRRIRSAGFKNVFALMGRILRRKG